MRRAMVTADEGEIAQTPVEFTGIHWQSWEGVEFSFFFPRKSAGGGGACGCYERAAAPSEVFWIM